MSQQVFSTPQLVYRIAWHVNRHKDWPNFAKINKRTAQAARYWMKTKMTQFTKMTTYGPPVPYLPNGEVHGFTFTTEVDSDVPLWCEEFRNGVCVQILPYNNAPNRWTEEELRDYICDATYLSDLPFNSHYNYVVDDKKVKVQSGYLNFSCSRGVFTMIIFDEDEQYTNHRKEGVVVIQTPEGNSMFDYDNGRLVPPFSD